MKRINVSKLYECYTKQKRTIRLLHTIYSLLLILCITAITLQHINYSKIEKPIFVGTAEIQRLDNSKAFIELPESKSATQEEMKELPPLPEIIR